MTRTYEFRPDASFLSYVSVHISDTQKEMLMHIKKEFGKYGEHYECISNTAAQNTPTATREFPPEIGAWHCNRFTTIYLNHADLKKNTIEIISHESAHAAMAHERYVTLFDMRYGLGNDEIENEERLAYKVGQITNGLYKTLAKDRKDRMIIARKGKKNKGEADGNRNRS